MRKLVADAASAGASELIVHCETRFLVLQRSLPDPVQGPRVLLAGREVNGHFYENVLSYHCQPPSSVSR